MHRKEICKFQNILLGDFSPTGHHQTKRERPKYTAAAEPI